MIDKETVQHIARLARLELSQPETEKMQADLAEILGYIDMLNEIDTSNIEPTSHSIPLLNITRNDNPHFAEQETIESMLTQAPQRQENYYKVKEIL